MNVKEQSIHVFLFRLAGVIILSWMIVKVPDHVSYYLASESRSFWLFSGIVLAPILISVSVALFLLSAYGLNVARVGTTLNGDISSSEFLSVLNLQRVALVCIGMFMLVEGLGTMAFGITRLVHASYLFPNIEQLEPSGLGELARGTMVFGVAVLLIKFSKPISSIIWRDKH